MGFELILAMIAARYLVEFRFTDLFYAARGEDPPSVRRQRERARRRGGPSPARSYWQGAWDDAWETANEDRQRRRARRADRRRERWDAQDLDADEAQARALNDAMDGRTAQCGFCRVAVSPEELREIPDGRGRSRDACPTCVADHNAHNADDQDDDQDDDRDDQGAQEQRDSRIRCGFCGMPAEDPVALTNGTQRRWACGICALRRSRPAPEAPPLCWRCGARPAAVGPRGLPLCTEHAAADGEPAAWPAPPAQTPGETTRGLPVIDDDHGRPAEEEYQPAPDERRPGGSPDAKVFNLADWQQPVAPPVQYVPTDLQEAPVSETHSLNAALAYTTSMAGRADQAVSSIEQSIAGLTAGGVSGPTITAMQAAQEAMANAAAQMRAAHNQLRNHIAVQEAYNANADAGTRQFVTQD